MNKDEVSKVVRAVSHELYKEGSSHEWDGYIVNPMHVWRRIRLTKPDVAAHIFRYYRLPDQHIKVWVPRS